jgi:hypothetical protein
VLTLSPDAIAGAPIGSNATVGGGAGSIDCKFKFTLVQACSLDKEEPETNLEDMNFPPYHNGCPWEAMLPCSRTDEPDQ